jgi:heterodisulfide reductase subunit C
MIIKLRNIAVEEGYILDAHFSLANNIFYATGHGVPANGEANKKWQDLRESYGLPPLPPTVHCHPEAVEEVQTLLKSVGFTELMENAAKLKEERKKQEAKEEEDK